MKRERLPEYCKGLACDAYAFDSEGNEYCDLEELGLEECPHKPKEKGGGSE